MRPFDASWYRALSLEERAALLGAAAAALPWDEAAAAQRLARWRGQNPFSDAAVFARRLATDGLDEPAFRRLLGVPSEVLAEALGSPPVWLEDVFEAQESLVTALPGDFPPSFLDVVAPFIEAAAARIRAGAEEIRKAAGGGGPFDPAQAGDIFFPLLPLRLEQILARSLAVELNIARLEGTLEGDTPEERFESFVRAACAPEARSEWLAANPVLARQLSLAVRQWSEVSLEILERLAADQAELRATFCAGEDPGFLSAVEGEAGDRHRGGRCVVVLRFASGFRLAYKPRPMAVDVHFGELLAWLDARGTHPPFRRLRVLDRGRYGWQEHAAPDACSSRQEIERFYERTGGYLALFYALEATDFHSENLIAAGEQPVPIDLESLFHGRIGGLAPTHPNSPAERALGHSVLRVGLLPEPIRDSGVDMSALGDTGDQVTPLPLPAWEDKNTDEMRIVRRPIRIPGSHNRPTLDGAAADPLEHSAAFLRGFTQIYRLLLAHRDELLAAGGPLDRFAGDELRALIRPTMVYARLLQESFHPFLLQSALERDRHFDLLWQAVPAHPFLEGAVRSEKADLLRGDIPSFTSRPGSRDLWDSRGRRLPDLFDEPPLDAVRRRLLQLSDEDLERQLWFIRVSLATLALEKGKARLPGHALARSAGPVSREELLAAARAVGDRLDLLAVRNEHDVSWLGVRMVDEVWQLVPLGPDLYDGLTGIALFLAHLGAVCGEERYTALARRALETARRQLASPEVPPLVGAFSGWGGILYTLLHLGSLWKDPALLAEAEELAAGRLTELLEQDESWDVITGSAGCLAVLLALHRTTGSERALAGAVRCGERLLAAARPAGDGGIGWITPGAVDRPLSGFSHGTAGIAWALASLTRATGDERFRNAARAALRYERTLFLPAVANWSDLRDMYQSKADGELMVAWCHGAAGIGLARLLTRPLLDDPEIDEEIEIALGTTLREGFGLNHSLCHGDFGNLETVLLAAQSPGGERWALEVDRLAAELLASVRQDGWLCAIPEGVETPGLMIGLAGIGYGLLRLAAPDRVPSVLALEAPAAAAALRIPGARA